MALIDTASATTRDQTRDEALPSDDWLSVKAFPRAVFKFVGSNSSGGDRYVAIGTLTIHGKAHAVSLPFPLAIGFQA